ncbi:MAG: DEAD/DEAH box helicase [Planctomycetota bacterium]|nr:DEAD/DEAH box helicase [Planctomycetota bacterium]
MSTEQEEELRFKDMDLSGSMLKALEHVGYEFPSPVQEGVIPLALDGYDVMGQARTGTGKTAAFAIPIIEQLASPDEIRKPQALVLVPTRELALQVTNEVERLSFGQQINTVAVYGGDPIHRQITRLKQGVQIVVGTPGRVLDHIQRGTLDLRETWCVVLDEADRMLDIGFRPDIERILGRCTCENRQTLLMSATVPVEIQRLAKKYMYEPEMLDFSPEDITVDTIDQYYFTVEEDRKFELLERLLDREEPDQTIVFCRTRRRTDRLQQRLSKKLPAVEGIHGDMPQSRRTRVMKKFRESQVKILVATDVIGRGIDVTGVSHIINFDTPQYCDDYVHRIGRTGRMGREGVAYTFVSTEEGKLLTQIEIRVNQLLERGEMDGFETVAREPLEDRKDKKAPPASLMKRPPKRYRRGV